MTIFFVKGAARLLLYGIFFVTLLVQKGQAQRFSTRGTDFWMGFMQTVPPDVSGSPTLYLYLSSVQPATGLVEVPGQSISIPFALAANDTELIALPLTQVMATGTGVQARAVHITSSDSISAFGLNYKQFATDATIILPTPTLRDEYLVMTYHEAQATTPGGCEMLVVATEDATAIEITVPGAATPINITLNAGQVYQLRSNTDLTGTRVKGIGPPCKRFAVFAGHQCASVTANGICGGNNCCCDHIWEQMHPINTWGKEFVFRSLVSRSADLIRVLASENGTTLQVNGGTPIALNAGQFHQFTTNVNQAYYIHSNQPVAVAQFSMSQDCGGIQADPFYIMLAPVEQMTVRDVTLGALDPNVVAATWTHYATIVTKTSNTGLVTINGVPPSNVWAAVPANPAYSITFEAFALSGNYRIQSDSGFTAYLYGFSNFDSYGYMAGFALDNTSLRAETDIPQQAACVGQPIAFTGTAVQPILPNGWAWFFGDGSTANGNPVLHSYQQPGRYSVKLEATAGSGCGAEGLDSAFVEVLVVGPGANITVDSVTCNGLADGRISLTGFGGLPPYTFTLPPFAPQTGPAATFGGLQAGSYSVQVEDGSACGNVFVLDVPEPPTLSVDIVARQTHSEPCLTDGYVVGRGIGGTPPYFYGLQGGPYVPLDTLRNLAPGQGSLEVADDNGCLASIVFDLPALPPVVAGPDTVLCRNLGGIVPPATSYSPAGGSWTAIGAQANPQTGAVAFASAAGSFFHLVYVTQGGCTDTLKVGIWPQPQPSFAFTPTKPNLPNNTVVLFESTTPGAGLQYVWTLDTIGTFHAPSFSHDFQAASEYQVGLQITDANGCVASTSQLVEVLDVMGIQLPTVFSPNGDGENEEWRAFATNVTGYTLHIYSRWGIEILSATGADANDIRWDGTHNGQPVPEGVYAYRLDCTFVNGHRQQLAGTITVLR